MRVLLDTHAFLWLISEDKRLGRKVRRAFLNPKNQIYLSAASLWEIGIKVSLGKLSLRDGWLKLIGSEMKLNTIQWLNIEMPHCEQLSRLPFHHRDPFDRMLIAQAMVEKMTVITRDVRFMDYGIDCIWD
jgi:PIN domain nuclease of toxin-antitoxin system